MICKLDRIIVLVCVDMDMVPVNLSIREYARLSLVNVLANGPTPELRMTLLDYRLSSETHVRGGELYLLRQQPV